MHDPESEEMTLEEFLSTKDEDDWFLTEKKAYSIQAMMVSGEFSFHNDLDAADYTVTDDGNTVVLKGTLGEMYATGLPKVIATYTGRDGKTLSADDFNPKDVFIDIFSIPSSDSNYAMHVPLSVCVSLKTASGDLLYANYSDTPHGEGDYLVCRRGADGKPDLTDVWVVNGAVFPCTYDLTHIE